MTDARKPLLIVEDDPALQKQMQWAFDKYETIVANDRQATSSRRSPSSSAVTINTPTSTQSRHPRAGASAARGSAHSERRAVVITHPA